MHTKVLVALFALQAFHVLFLSLHDWIPLGRLSDIAAVRLQNPVRKLVAGTLISTFPFAFGLVASAIYTWLGRSFPGWLFNWLWISYTVLFLGELRAWWIPYFFLPEPERAARYQIMFGHTHAFLPPHNGFRPNTLHVVLHLATLSILIVFGALMAARG
jgi:hypothetical protein